jgi:cytochrome c oxidase cbb3-type subunit 3
MKPFWTIALIAVALTACEREKREFRPAQVVEESDEKVALSPLSPGPSPPIQQTTGKGKSFEENALNISEGQKLYTWFNCNGCHSNGGGGSGPPLMDDRWIYGGSIENIVVTIREGRPNGMPSFRGKIPDDQIWQIAGYVRSMGRYTPKAASPARKDDMHPGPAEQRRPPAEMNQGGIVPPSASMPQ